MEREHERQEPLDVEVFYPRSVELVDQTGAHSIDEAPHRPHLKQRRGLTLALFVATCVSTFLVGFTPGDGLEGAVGLLLNVNHFGSPEYMTIFWQYLQNGVLFGGGLMLMLFAHEMGHYLQARRYHVPASLPYFIPLPISPFGTLGAVIVQHAGVADRKALFDIAISGPLAGLVIALPLTFVGLQGSTTGMLEPGQTSTAYGDPIIMQWMIEYVHGPLEEGEEVILNPLLFAGWVGIFVTALNLIPIGQLDGGHMLYTLIGKKSHLVATGLLIGAIGYMIYQQYIAYILMVVLLLLMGPRHPPTADDSVPLGWGRIVLGWATLAFIIIGFVPRPIDTITAPQREPSAEQQEQPEVATDDAAEFRGSSGTSPRNVLPADTERLQAASAKRAVPPPEMLQHDSRRTIRSLRARG